MQDSNRYRTKEEQIEYFKSLSYQFSKDAHDSKDEREGQFFRGKAEAYELAAFELEHNMK